MRKIILVPVISLTLIWLMGCGSSSSNTIIPPGQTLTSNFAFVRVDNGGGLQAQHRLQEGSPYVFFHQKQLAAPLQSGVAGNESVLMMKNDGTGSTVLVSGIGPIGSVQLSLDGKKGVSMEADENGYMQIYAVDMTNLQNLHAVQLTTDSEDHVMPQFSPDNSKVIYHKWISGTLSQAFTVNTSGGAETQILTPNTYVLFPAYTPDGKKIVFATFDSAHTYEGISIMNADGSGITTLTGAAGSYDGYPSVSPDGKTIVFYRYTTQTNGGTEDIYTVGIDGSNLKQLTTDGESWDPMYVNDKIVFVSSRDHNGAGEIYSMGLDGNNQKNLTNDAVDEFFFWD